MQDIKNLAEYQLEQMLQNMEVSKEQQESLEAASNFYMVPHTVIQRYNSGNVEEIREVNLYTINDVEGYGLYTLIDNQYVTMNKSFSDKIREYLRDNYSKALEDGSLKESDIIEHFTPNTVQEMYDMLGSKDTISMRFLPARIDEYAQEKGISKKQLGEIEQRENLEEKYQEQSEKPEEEQEKEEQVEAQEEPKAVNEEELEEKEESEEQVETYIEKIARFNHVKPAVVNTRVIENFEKVEEDTGIQLRGRYQRGDVVAVRIPYKLGYRTFLAEKDTGITIDGQGRRETRPRLYNSKEIGDYFRFDLRDGRDGGENGIPLRYDEGRDYTTYIDVHGDLKEQKFINNGKAHDMERQERQRYLVEVAEVDKRLKEAIDEYQKNGTRENYEKVRGLIKEKVDIDNKYNALGEQRKITKETKENTEKVIGRDLDDDDDEWFPGPPGPRYR